MKNIKRRDFIATAGATGLLVFLGCGKHEVIVGNNDDDCGNGAGVAYNGDGFPHAHTGISLTAGEVAAAAPGVYMLLAGPHTHTFNITGGNFTTLTTTGTVTVGPDIEGDGHTITITC